MYQDDAFDLDQGIQEGQQQGDGQEADGIVHSGEAPENGDATPSQERVTTPYMTKYERARILGTRALQIRSVYFSPGTTSEAHKQLPQHECASSRSARPIRL